MIKRFNIMSYAQKLENNWRQKAIKIEHLEISAEEEIEKLYSIAIESTGLTGGKLKEVVPPSIFTYIPSISCDSWQIIIIYKT